MLNSCSCIKMCRESLCELFHHSIHHNYKLFHYINVIIQSICIYSDGILCHVIVMYVCMYLCGCICACVCIDDIVCVGDWWV